jgi:hypothetical protein
MRIIRLAVALTAMVCLAASSALARETGGQRGTGSSKAKSAKHSKVARSKSSAAKRKASAKSARARTVKEKKLRSTGDIDVSSTIWQNIPAEELPASEGDDADIDDEADLMP